MTRKTLTWGHVAFDTSGLFRKIAVRLDSPYLQQIASIRKMPTYAIACRTSIRRSKRANYQLIEQLNFVQNRFFEMILYTSKSTFICSSFNFAMPQCGVRGHQFEIELVERLPINSSRQPGGMLRSTLLVCFGG